MPLETVKEVMSWLEKCFGAKEGVIDYPTGRRWSFYDLNDYSRRICASYKKDGLVKKGDRVGWLSLKPGADIVALSFGGRKMGAIPVIMNARAGIESIAWMINNVGVKVLSYASDCAELLKKLRKIGIPSVREYIALDERLDFPGELALDEIYQEYKGADEPKGRITAKDDCMIIYTSGTTGRPKPVLHKEEGWSWTSMILAYQFGLYFDDVTLVSNAPNFVAWAHATGRSLRAAAKQCCIRFSPHTYLKAISDVKPTHGNFSPTLVRMLYEEFKKYPEEFRLDSLRISMISGELVTEDVLTMAKEMFPNLIRISSVGATESVSLHSGLFSPYLSDHWNTVGKPHPGVTAELRDVETGKVITEAERPGELYVKGLGVSHGIWNDPESTEKNFPKGWWKTGDLLRRDGNEYYYFSGRSDHLFKSGGIKIYSEEVEENLKKHPAVMDAVVVPIPHDTFGFVGFAHIRHVETLSAEEMEKWWQEQGFARFSRPRSWKFWGQQEFPRVTEAKIDRKRLRQIALEE
jgi:fatty-acyl-CoA synthase